MNVIDKLPTYILTTDMHIGKEQGAMLRDQFNEGLRRGGAIVLCSGIKAERFTEEPRYHPIYDAWMPVE